MFFLSFFGALGPLFFLSFFAPLDFFGLFPGLCCLGLLGFFVFLPGFLVVVSGPGTTGPGATMGSSPMTTGVPPGLLRTARLCLSSEKIEI